MDDTNMTTMGQSFEDILTFARIRMRSTSERPGQAFFNVLFKVRPELAVKITGTDDDPFYIDGNIEKCRALFDG